jgi:SAM-dependent methyltransferase
MALPEWFLHKRFTARVNKAIELFLPPVISDRKFIACLFNYLQGRGFRYFDVTRDPVNFSRCSRNSDFTDNQMAAAMGLIVGTKILDIGCGKGLFIKRLAAKGMSCIGVDPNQVDEKGENWKIIRGYAEALDFQDSNFDTVVSFKALEHIPDAKSTLILWRNLARSRIVLLLPCQRYRRYVYDGHINFYPDEFQLRLQLGLADHAVVEKIEGDWLIHENIISTKV